MKVLCNVSRMCKVISRGTNFSGKHKEHENGKEISEEVKDFVKYNKDTKILINEEFCETLLQQVPCSIDPFHSHKMGENIVVDIQNNLCSLPKGHEAGDQQMSKERERIEIIMPDNYCNGSANIPVCNAHPMEINIQNELDSLQGACESDEPEIGNEKENATINMPHIDCNDGATFKIISHGKKRLEKACPSNAQRRNLILKIELNKLYMHVYPRALISKI